MSYRNVTYVLVASLILVSASGAEKAPLPSKMAEAKSIFLICQTGNDKHLDSAYEALKKWGKWEIVQKREEADLVILLNTTAQSGSVIFSSGTVIPGTGVAAGTGTAIPVEYPTFYLHVIDAKNGDDLWVAKNMGRTTAGGTVRNLVDKLKKRMGRE